MSNPRLAFTPFIPSFIPSLISSLFALALASIVATTIGCADSTPPASPDAAPPDPIDPSGRYTVASAYALSAPPAVAGAALGELTAMADSPDDPSRYLIDLMIDKLPDGSVKTYATTFAPYVAAYVNQRIAQVAPRFVAGSHALSAGLMRVAQRFGTTETFDIAVDGPRVEGDDQVAESRWLTRTIIGVRFEAVNPGASATTAIDVRFAPLGLPDVATKSIVMLDGVALGGAATQTPDRFTIMQHTAVLPYARMLRLGFDFAVIPDVVPGTHDLASALAQLVDCNRLGAAVSECLGIGSPSFYATACSASLAAVATKLYARLDTIDPDALSLELAGDARAVDANRDSAMDAIAAGTWSGEFAGVAATGGFDGATQ